MWSSRSCQEGRILPRGCIKTYDCEQVFRCTEVSEGTKGSLVMSRFSKPKMQHISYIFDCMAVVSAPNPYMNMGLFPGTVLFTYHTKHERRRQSPQGDQAAYTAAGRPRSCST